MKRFFHWLMCDWSEWQDGKNQYGWDIQTRRCSICKLKDKRSLY